MFAAQRDPILTTSSDGRVSDFNEAATALLGPAVRLYGRPIRELLPFLSSAVVIERWVIEVAKPAMIRHQSRRKRTSSASAVAT